MNKKLLTGLTCIALCTAATAVMAEPSWTLSAGVEGDNVGARTTDAAVSWSPSQRFSMSAGAGTTRSDEEQGDFNSNDLSVDAEWWPVTHFGLGGGYETWKDSGSYEKNTGRAALYFGGSHVRLGIVGESIDSQTTAQVGLLRRDATISFDGKGFGGELRWSGDRTDLSATFVSYEYDDSVDRLLTFLSNPNLSSRPRLEQLTNSALTASDALLDRAATLGANFYFGKKSLGLTLSQYRELLTESDANAVQVDFAFPVSRHWTATLTAGVNDSEDNGTTYLMGGRVSFGTR